MSVVRLLPSVALAALAGCGGSSSSDSGSTKTADPAAAKPAKKTPASSSGSAAKKSLAVAIKNFEYAPTKATVAMGAKVTWTNQDAANHTVTFDTGSKQDLGSQAKGAKKSFTFAKAGSFAYHCNFHPNMHGTIVVR